MAGNLWSSGSTSNKIYQHSGETSTITTSFSSPSTYCSGLVWFDSDLWSVDTTAVKIYQHSGGTSTITTSFSTPSTAPSGLAFDGTNIWSSDVGQNKIYQHSGETSTITTSFSSPSTYCSGLVWFDSDLWSIDYGNDAQAVIYHHSGGTATITSSFSAPATDAFSITWDGTHLWSCAWDTDKIYKHSGNTSTVTTSFASPDTTPTGLAWEPIVAPTVTTQTADAIVPGGATLNGNITDDGDLSITQHGFCWKAGSDPVNIAGADGYSELGAGSEGAFDQAKTGLAEATRFYYRAYATNSVGTSYGTFQFWDTGETLSGVVAVTSAQSMTIAGVLIASGSVGINSASVLSALQALKAVGSVDVSQAVTITALQTRILSSAIAAISQAASLSLVGEIGKHYAVCAITSAATTVQSGGLIASGVSEIETGTEASVSSSAIMQAITGITTSAELSAEAHRLLSAIIAMTAACSLSALIVSVEHGVVEITTSSSLTAAAILYMAQVLGYTGTLTADDVLVIDCDKMTMKKNGVEDRENHSDDFWHLFVGDSEIVWTDSEGARTIKLEIVHSPRYL